MQVVCLPRSKKIIFFLFLTNTAMTACKIERIHFVYGYDLLQIMI